MLGGSGLPPLDLPALLQFGITALALVCGLLFVVRNAASRYFVVDAGFDAGEPRGYEARREMSIGDEKCFVCGRLGSKKCARCKSVRYCSQGCQAKHWKDGHKLKCKEPKLLNDSTASTTNGGGKSSGFGSSIALVPARGSCKVLQQPKKILFPYEEFVKLFNWDKQNFPPCGLLNCGNSCFANVVLQCLACTRPLVAYLLEGSHLRTCSRNDWCFLCELQIHVQKVTQSMKPFSPINILSRLPKIGGNLGNGRQEDAHEFMRFAIDTMQSVCLDEFGGEKSIDTSIQETTLIQHIFGGHLQSQVKCTKCDKISNRYENMMDLTVEIQGDAESLEECLNQFTGKEWLDGENMYKCDGCDEYVKAWKRLTVHQPPNILTVALKRFQGGRFGKLNKRVTFPETLDLRPYMSGAGDGTDLYTLYAVVVHIDMLNASFFGHYICYTKDFYGNWYRIDDCKVVKVDVEEVLAQGAYMLLYSRINVRQPSIKRPNTSKIEDEKSVEMASASLSNPVQTNSMVNQSEKELFQMELGGLDPHLPVKVDGEPAVQDLGSVGLNVLQSSDLDRVQETDLDRSQKMDLDVSPESDSCMTAVDDVYSGSSVAENLHSVFSVQNPLSLKELEGKTDSFQTSVNYQFMKENGPIRTSDEFFEEAAKTSISVVIPALHEMPEPTETNTSGPRSDHMTKVNGSSDLAVRENGLHYSLSSAIGQEDLVSLCIDSMSTEDLEQPSSICFVEKDSMVKEDMNIENGVGHFCRCNNCNRLECECDNLSSKENLKPLFYPGFLDNHIQKKTPNEKTQMKSDGVGHSGNDFAGNMEISQLNNTAASPPDSGNNCNGLLDESQKLSSTGSPETSFCPGLLNGHAKRALPNGKAETESGAVGVPCGTPTENGQLDFHGNGNVNCNGLLHEPDKSNARGPAKPLFSRGFLDYKADKRSLKVKTQKQSGVTLCSKDNVNHFASCYRESIQQNGDDYDANQKSLYENGKHNRLDSSDVALISHGFLNKSYEKSQRVVETLGDSQNGCSLPSKANCNRC